MSGPLSEVEMDDFEQNVIQVLTQRPDGRLARAIITISGKATSEHLERYHGGKHPGTMPMGSTRTIEEIADDLEIEEP